LVVTAACLFLLFSASNSVAQKSATKPSTAVEHDHQATQSSPQSRAQMDLLKQFNASLESLIAKVSPAVVEVHVEGFGPLEDAQGGKAALVGRQDKLGSGVIVDSTGYIVTNAHVVSGARRVEVVVTRAANSGDAKAGEGPEDQKTTFTARIVGVHKDTDLALLKIDATELPFLPLDPKHPIHAGQLVFALGNPEGLGNSVSMGVVSAVDRQPDPRLPMVYIQTDAPINPGNSGGALVDVDGHLLGINTFIVTSGGGSEGLGFAIPPRVVSFVIERLRKFGHVDRSEIGASSVAITPVLAKGLNLPVTSGVVIVDVTPGGPADTAGLKINDVVRTMDGRPIRSLPQLVASLYLHPTDQKMTVDILRGAEKLTLDVPVVSQRHDMDQLLDVVDPEKNRVHKIGVLAIDVDARILALLPDMRIKSGAIVVANTNRGRELEVGLRPGDVIHSVNLKPVLSLADLQREIAALEAGAAVVLQVERADGMDYIAFEME
jgi:serine protease Do